MSFKPRGIPLHTRSLSVVLREGSAGALDFEGYVIDLRKRGVVPVAGDLQGPGIIHQMHLDGTVDRTSLNYEQIEAQMPQIAFEASPGTGGESCRDTIANVRKLGGASVVSAHARNVSKEIGGARGCSHLLTLTHLLGPTLEWAISHENSHHPPGTRHAGERVFRRDVTIDGHLDGEDLVLLAQLNDLHLSDAASCEQTTDLLEAQREVRIQCTAGLGDRIARDFYIETRLRTAATLENTAWTPSHATATELSGLSLGPGVAAALLAKFSNHREQYPLRDTLLQLAPAVIQCFASCHDNWTQLGSAGVAETGGMPDSCYMWRQGGALTRTRLQLTPE